MDQDRRQHSRAEMNTGVFVVHGEQAFLSELENVSAGGVSIRRPPAWRSDHGGVYSLYFILDEERIWCIKCAVCHEQKDRLGFSFEPGYATQAERLLGESRSRH